MKTLESLVGELSDQELKVAFNEITNWKKIGVLEDGIVRKVHGKFNNEAQTEFPIFMIEQFFTYEMAKRWINKEE